MSIRATFLRLLAKPILKLALSGTNIRLIIQNSDDRRRLIAGGLVNANSIRLIRGAGVDPKDYCKAPPDAEVPLIVLPARLLHEKGVGEFVEAARILKEGGIQARFALVGRPDSANPASVTQAEVDAWVREGVVEAWGWQEDMHAIFCKSQIVCLPSYHEGLPKALLEAAASGCGIVATDIPGCREIVQQGETGWLVPPRNVQALAEALQEAILLPERRKQYGTAARAAVAANFSIQNVIRETMAVYGELITDRARP
jgi:glycosyltransferase involved in cell wall biosynthesis